MDARQADSEPIPQGLASPYAQAALRGFTHFSASRSDTRAQFRRWLSGEPLPGFRFAGAGFGQNPASRDLNPAAPSSSMNAPDLEPSFAAPLPSTAPAGAALSPRQDAPPLPQEPDRGDEAEEIVPQWLSSARQQPSPVEDAGKGEGEETLAGAEQSFSSHWLFLKEVFAPPPDAAHSPETAGGASAVPSLAAFSIAGGTGKTTLLATLARALAARGERILLVDTASLSMAPCYFGARPVAGPPAGGAGSGPAHEAGAAPDTLRTFAPPKGRNAAPVDVLPIGAQIRGGISPGESDPIRKTLLRHCGKADRILVDMQSGWESLARRLFWLQPLVLAPLLPEMNSVASVAALEAAFAGDLAAGTITFVYLLNQYDASVPLHLDVRAALERRLGDRLLPFVVRRSPEVSEALAEGMTVIDYAPGSPAAEDYARLADWVSGAAPAASPGLRQLRWSER